MLDNDLDRVGAALFVAGALTLMATVAIPPLEQTPEVSSAEPTILRGNFLEVAQKPWLLTERQFGTDKEKRELAVAFSSFTMAASAFGTCIRGIGRLISARRPVPRNREPLYTIDEVPQKMVEG